MQSLKGYSIFFYRLFLVAFFSLAMGFFEAVLVVYLRFVITQGRSLMIFSVSDFMNFVNSPFYVIEQAREFATIVMLVTISLLLGKSWREKVAYFFFVFGIWDIVYYLSLKLLLRWPPSLLTKDVIFLIPRPWVAGVYVPLAASILMIVVSLYLWKKEGCFENGVRPHES